MRNRCVAWLWMISTRLGSYSALQTEVAFTKIILFSQYKIL